MRIGRILVVATGIIALTACGADTRVTDAVVSSVEGGEAIAAPELVGGGNIDPEALSEGTTVALWFWAPG